MLLPFFLLGSFLLISKLSLRRTEICYQISDHSVEAPFAHTHLWKWKIAHENKQEATPSFAKSRSTVLWAGAHACCCCGNAVDKYRPTPAQSRFRATVRVSTWEPFLLAPLNLFQYSNDAITRVGQKMSFSSQLSFSSRRSWNAEDLDRPWVWYAQPEKEYFLLCSSDEFLKIQVASFLDPTSYGPPNLSPSYNNYTSCLLNF